MLAWLAGRLAHLVPSRPPGQGGTPPPSLEVRLDAVAAVLLTGLSYRPAGRADGISKTAVPGQRLGALDPDADQHISRFAGSSTRRADQDTINVWRYGAIG